MVRTPNLGNLQHLLRRELEGEHSQVIAHPLFLAGGGDGHDILIHAPAQQDLSWVDVVLLGEACEVVVQRAVGGPGGRGEGTVGGEGDIVLAVVGEQVAIAVLEVGVVFDLVDCWAVGGGV